MKQQGTLALVLVCFAATAGLVASVTKRATRRVLRAARGARGESEVDEELSDGGAEEERTVLLNKLSRVENLARTEREALQAQQRVLVALEQEQEVLEVRTQRLEANQRAMASGRVVVDKGTVSNTVRHAPIIRQKVAAERMKIVDVKADTKHSASHHLAADNDSGKGGFVFLLGESEKEFWDKYNKAFYEKLIGIAVYLVQIFVVAFLYMNYCKHAAATKVPEREVRTEEFQFGPFDGNDFGRDCQICICALCCPWIRWAETSAAPQIQFLAFLPGLFITAVLASASSVTFGASLLILLIVVLLCRQRIRDIYGLPSGTCQIIFCDCLLWVCCPCCAIAQEARQVEYVDIPMQRHG